MHTRRIFFKQLALDARIGILEHELRSTQPLHIDAQFDVRVTQAVQDNQLRSVLDYRLLRETLVQECTRTHINLLETLVERVIDTVLEKFPDVMWVRVRISKPGAFSDCAAVGIEQEGVR